MSVEARTQKCITMPEYDSNQSKPEKILTGYGTVRGAELKELYDNIATDTPLLDIQSRFGRPRGSDIETDHIDNCIRFLRTLDMIEENQDGHLNRINQDIFPDFNLSFEPRLLHHIQQQDGNQSHLAAIHDVAIDSTSSNRDEVSRISVEELKINVERETDYNLEWKEEKILMWANLLSPVGAISYSSKQDEILLNPCRGLLCELLSHHYINRTNGDSLLAALEWIDNEFFPVFSKRAGQPVLHTGITDVFENLVEDGVLTITGMSDRTEVVNLPRQIDDTKTPADYSIEDPRDQPAYWYPLDRSERRCKP